MKVAFWRSSQIVLAINELKMWWKIIVIIIIPILFLPIPIVLRTDAARCGYVILVLVSYWISETIPLFITSLLPLILFPIFGLLPASEVASDYFRDITLLFFGNVIFSNAIQNVNLHQRVALCILNIVGSSIARILAGLMITAWFLSMWINNSSTTLIMLPIALKLADEYSRCLADTIEANESSKLIMDTDQERNDVSKKNADNIRKSLIICVAYSATYGGSVTIVGSPLTTAFKGYVDEVYNDTSFHLSFMNYFFISLPTSTIMLIFCWIWLQVRYGLIQRPMFDNRAYNDVSKQLSETMKKQYDELGRLRWNELVVGVLFLLELILWITYDLGKKHGGWSVLFRHQYVTNSTVALFIAILAMCLPNDKPFTGSPYKPIVTWTNVLKNFPWEAMGLLGASFTIAHASEASKLMDSFAKAFVSIHTAPTLAVLVAVIAVSELLTQFVTGLSIAAIFFPVASVMSSLMNVHPAFLLVPCTLALSQSFLFPISSPPNAIVFSTKFIRTYDLITTGIVLNVFGGFVIFIAATTWMLPILGVRQYAHTNVTFINSTFP